jgi:MFS family permease
VSLFAVALAPSLALLALAFMAYGFASNTALAPWQALLPDQVAPSRRGAASGLKTMFEILAFVAGRRTAGYLIADEQILASVAIAALVFGLSMLFTTLAARESRPSDPVGQAMSQRSSTPSTAAAAKTPWPPGFGWWFLNRGLFWGGLIALSSFVLFYLEDVVGMSFAEASRFFGDLSLVLGLSLLAIALPAGRLSDRIGRRPLILVSCLVAILGNAVLLGAASFWEGVDVRGEALSVGERQLVALARAYVANPDLLVLDEATSSVDPATEVRIQRALDGLTRGRTAIAIAHRLSTAEQADEVLVFDRGRLAQRGSHAELVGQPGPYRRLHESWSRRSA